MKEIIKRGTKEVTKCITCGCEFSYEPEDVLEKDTDNYKGFKKYTTCPQCNHEVVLWQTR